MGNTPLLQINSLTTSFHIDKKYYPAVDNVSLTVKENEIVAIVGESGCGKSALALSIMQLHPKQGVKMEGEVRLEDKNLLQLTESEMKQIRGKEIGFIFQDPLTSLNPVLTIGYQIEEAMKNHFHLSKSEFKSRTIDLLNKVGIPDPERTYFQYPHELSGGMRQRIVIAIAIACEPKLLIADEPTTALDVTIQSQILDLMVNLQERMKTGIILITHDLGVVAEIADRVAVMYAGEIVELADVHQLFNNPLHPYTKSLFHSMPTIEGKNKKLHAIEGIVPPLQHLPRTGCRFQERIPWVDSTAHEEHPKLHEVEEGHWVRCTCYQQFEFPKTSTEDSDHVTS